MKLILLFLTILASNSAFSANNVSIKDFAQFEGTWKITDESVSKADNSWNFESVCNTSISTKRRPVFRVKVDLKTKNSEYYIKGDLTVTLEHLWNPSSDGWGRAFDRAPFVFNIDGKRFSVIDGYRYSYTSILENENLIFNKIYDGESLRIVKSENKTLLIYKFDYDTDDGISTKCIFER